MANGNSVMGASLLVGRTSCEKARERYRIPKDVHVPHEHPMGFQDTWPILDDDSDETGSFVSMGGDDFDDVNTMNNALVMTGMPLAAISAEMEEVMNDPSIFGSVTDGDSAAANAAAAATATAVGFNQQPQDQQQDYNNNGIQNTVPLDWEPERLTQLPKIARHRLNLTGLSQRYNLYFAVYRNEIHVSRVLSCVTHKLPSAPTLILTPGPSAKASQVTPAIDRFFPHQVNQMIVGEYGIEEILLLAYDDGDVIGFYTRQIEDEVIRREHDPHTAARPPLQFFHENVRQSAWGLAVHRKSRLIAVGTNAHAVRVFIPALTGSSYSYVSTAPSNELYRVVKIIHGHQRLSRCKNMADEVRRALSAETQRLVAQRNANWVIVLETGDEGDNIPNVAFSDDEDGNAIHVVAIDVAANLWKMNVWSWGDGSFVKIPSVHRRPPQRLAHQGWLHPGNEYGPRGWGVLVLPESSFMPTDSSEQALGLPSGQMRHFKHPNIGEWIDISKASTFIGNNSVLHPVLRSRERARPLNRIDEVKVVEARLGWARSYVYQDNNNNNNNNSSSSSSNDVPRDNSSVPNNWPSGAPLCPLTGIPHLELEDGSCIMRTYQTDIELRSPEYGGCSIFFEHATRQTDSQYATEILDGYDRLANTLHIPELSLVIAGSMSGRVALITLTKPHDASRRFKRGFKIEAILPTKDDEDSGLRPLLPLLGIAAGPIPDHLSLQSDPRDPTRHRRYRLMLQFYDLRVLSYEIRRGAPDDCLEIV